MAAGFSSVRQEAGSGGFILSNNGIRFGPGRRGDCGQRLGAAGFPGCTWLAPAAAAPPHPLNPVTGTVVRRNGTDG